MVADGMGAHAVGELASKLACDNIPHAYNKLKSETASDAIVKAYQRSWRHHSQQGDSESGFSGHGHDLLDPAAAAGWCA